MKARLFFAIVIACIIGTSAFSNSDVPEPVSKAVIKATGETNKDGLHCDDISIAESTKASGRYWIGGTGNWSDTLHWSNASGGPSCNCVPTPSDDVFFDANSFTGNGQLVTVNTTAYCKDMIWTGAANASTLTGGQTLYIYGSLILDTNINITYTGGMYFKSSSAGNTIRTFGKTLPYIAFDGVGGEWTLQGNLTSNGSIDLTAGSLITNNKNVSATRFSSTGSGIRALTLGSSIISVSYGSYYNAWEVSGSNVTLNAGTSSINLSSGSYAYFSAANFTYYNVNFTNPAATGVNLQTSGAVFHDVSIAGNGSISGAATYNNLTLGTSKNTSISGIQTINGTFTSNGTCSVPAILTGGTLSKSSGTVTINYVRLQNVVASGGAIFTANNVTDFGNNNGWGLNLAPSQNLYWIGNGGIWTDANHWSLTSGGTSSGCIPTPYDNVYFNASSFSGGGQTVNVDQVAYCRSMDWTGAVASSTLTGSQTLNIYGSFILNPNMNVTFTGGIYFKSNNPGNTIQTSGKTMPYFAFDGLGGEWILQDNLTTTGSIDLTTGSLNTNGMTVSATRFSSTGSGIRMITLGASDINVSYGSYYNAWEVSGSNVSVSAGTSTINLSGASYAYFYAANFTYYNISFTNPATTGVNLQNSNANFHNVTIAGDASISGSATYNNLTLGTSKNTSISGTQTIIGTFICDGTCGNPSTLNGGTLNKTTGTVTINYTRMQGVTATGGATFTANNVTDLGGNNGWNITFTSQNLYWVGNGGNWTDPSHWSLSSGGPISGCIPTKNDNVYFDINSFSGGGQTVNIDQTAYCKSMDWTGALSSSILGGSQTFYIYGSLVLNPNMNVTYTGGMYFKSNAPGNTIQTSGKTISYIAFDGIGGEWTLQDNLTSAGSIDFSSGSLNTNNKNVSATRFSSTGSGIRLLTLGSSTISVSYGSYYNAWEVSGSNITLNSGTSTINLSGGNYAYFFAANFTYHNVNFTNPTATGVNLQTSGANFHDVSIAGDASISGAASYNNLSLGTSKTTNLSGTQTVSGTFTCKGTCSVPAVLTSGTISKSSGTVTINYVRLQNVVASGGAVFTANNVTDFGNNNGWNLNLAPSQNLYWVGNGGIWSDANHWSFTSGGPGSGCIPSPYDNVFFNANSFSGGGQTVNVDQVAYCRSMDWTGAISSSTFTGNQTLNVFGSLILNPNMNFTFAGGIYFKSNSPGNTIQTSGKIIPYAAFDGLGGEWILQDNLTTSGSIDLTTGALNTNGMTVSATRFSSTGSGIRMLTLGSSILNVSYGSYYNAWEVSGSNVTLNSGTSIINLSGGNYAYFYGANFTYYDVNFTNVAATGVNFQTSNAIFHDVSIAGSGSISGTATYNDLTLGTSKSTSISGTQIINGTFTCNGTSGSLSSISGGTISKASSIVCLNYVNIASSTASGGAVFYAANSVNLGGNSGWIFGTCAALPSAPANPIISTVNCTSATLSFTGTPPAGVIWYWQGTSCGALTNLGSGSTFNVSSSGTYYIRAYDNNNGFWSTSCGSVTVNILTTPPPPTVTSPVTLCQYENAPPLTATGSNLLWYTGQTGGTGTPTAPVPQTSLLGTTTYYVSQTLNTCESSRVGISVIVNPYPGSAGTISGSAVVCQRQNGVVYSVPLIANAATYSWTLPLGSSGSSSSNSITVNFGPASAPGDIIVKGHNGCGDGTSSSLYIAVVPAPNAFAGNDTTICPGASITLTATGGNSYNWNNGVMQGIQFTPVATQTYTVSVSNGYCTSTDSIVVAIATLPTTPVIYQAGNTLYSTALSGNQWYNDQGAITGANAQSYTPYATSHYYVIVTDIYGCISDTSNVLYVVHTGTDFIVINEINIEIYPNPAQEAFFISLPNYSPDINCLIELYDISGKLLKSKQTADKISQISITGLADGVYIVKVIQAENVVVKRLIKK